MPPIAVLSIRDHRDHDASEGRASFNPEVGNSQHCGWSGNQQPEVTAYVQKYLVGRGTADTNILKTDGGYGFDQGT